MAVKSIDATIPDEAAAGRLRREGRVVAALRHPSIVTVYEMLVSSAGVALVMEFVPGGDLRHAIDSGWLSGSHAAAVLCDVAAALEHAHQRGIVHRDVKPANVLLSPGGRAKLADFGLARLPRSSDGFRTIAGGVAGTPMYLAPEQIVHPDFESPTIDAYSFAVLCYEVLTGAKPFAATTMPALVYAHLHQAPLPPWRHAPELPVPVGEILLAGLAKNPDQRPSPAQVAESLRSVSAAQWDGFFGTPRAQAVVREPGSEPEVTMVAPPQFTDHEAPGSVGDRPASDLHSRPTRRLRRRVTARLVGVVVGITLGLLVVLALHH